MMSANSFFTSDKTIRAVLLDKLNNKYLNHPNTAIIPELTLPHGSARIDIAVVNGVMHGYELKSDVDTLLRLASQVDAYNLIFDKVTLVTSRKHIKEALHLIPDWWGITIAKSLENRESPILLNIRTAKNNPSQDLFTIANLLWRTEALDILSKIGKSNRLQNKSKKIICERLVESMNKRELKDHVRSLLIKRVSNSNWRAV